MVALAVRPLDDQTRAKLVEQFMEGFYAWPAYERVGAALSVRLRRLDALDVSERRRLIGWFARVALEDPSVVRQYTTVRDTVADANQRLFVAQIIRATRSHSAVSAGMRAISSRADLDAAWIEFSVRGTPEPVLHAIDVLEHEDRVATKLQEWLDGCGASGSPRADRTARRLREEHGIVCVPESRAIRNLDDLDLRCAVARSRDDASLFDVRSRSLPFELDTLDRYHIDLKAAAMRSLGDKAAHHPRVLETCREERNRRQLRVRIALHRVIRTASAPRGSGVGRGGPVAVTPEPRPPTFLVALAVPIALIWETGRGAVIDVIPKVLSWLGRIVGRAARAVFRCMSAVTRPVVRTVQNLAPIAARAVVRVARAPIRTLRWMARNLWRLMRRLYAALPWLMPIMRVARLVVGEVVDGAVLLRRLAIHLASDVWHLLCTLWPWIRERLASVLRALRRVLQHALAWARAILHTVARTMRSTLRLLGRVARRAAALARAFFRTIWPPIRAALRAARFALRHALSLARALFRTISRPLRTALRVLRAVASGAWRVVRSVAARAVELTRAIARQFGRVWQLVSRIVSAAVRRGAQWARYAAQRLLASVRNALTAVRRSMRAVALAIADAFRSAAARIDAWTSMARAASRAARDSVRRIAQVLIQRIHRNRANR